MPHRFHVRDLGLIPYQEAWDLQKALLQTSVDAKLANRNLPPDQQQPVPHHLLVCQHPPVYTLGKSGKDSHLLADEAELAAIGATYVHIERGGDITFHGPGQLVVYPILDLDQIFTDLARYLRALEEAVILTLAQYGLQAGRIPGLTGVWLDVAGAHPRKICAMGIKCARWVTMHGLALNVNTDLGYFNRIVPCGIADPDKGVTSLQAELGHEIPMSDVQQRLLAALAQVFEAELVPAVAVSG